MRAIVSDWADSALAESMGASRLARAAAVGLDLEAPAEVLEVGDQAVAVAVSAAAVVAEVEGAVAVVGAEAAVAKARTTTGADLTTANMPASVISGAASRRIRDLCLSITFRIRI